MGITKSLYQWCVENDNNNLLANWDYEKNGDLTPCTIGRYSMKLVHFKCHICGNEYIQRMANAKSRNGCIRCRGNKYYDIGVNGDYIVYCHLAPNGKRYIGMTGMRLCKRFSPFLYYGEEFKEDIKKYGWENIEHIILECGLTKEQASEKEIYYIKYFNTLDSKYGYNKATGGIHGGTPHTVSEETKKKISDAHKGMKRSVEARKRMSIAHIGKDNHQSRKVYKTDKNGQFIEEYSSIKEAAKKNGCNYKSLAACLAGKRKSYVGCYWKYVT